jgi:hypothetical protein
MCGKKRREKDEEKTLSRYKDKKKKTHRALVTNK